MNELLIKHFERNFTTNRMSHAFLICNTFYDCIKDDLEYILSNYFFDGSKNIYDNPDIYIIRPSNDKIVKEDILSLQDSFKTKSLLNRNKVYIIESAEKMNSYASNALLKFLEEPEQNIYGILISSNLNKVLSTIKSRCQILMVDNESLFNLNEFDSNYVSNVVNIIDLFENYGYDSISYIYEYINKKIEKEDLKIIIKIVKYFYRDCLNYLLFNTINIFVNYKDIIDKIVKKNCEKIIVDKLFILLKEESKLEYNVNTNLFLDNLLIELEKVRYE